MPEGIWMPVFVALWVLLLAQSAMLVVLSRHMRKLICELDHMPDVASVGPAIGATAPEIKVADITGKILSLGGIAARKRLLLFLSLDCPACRAALREVKEVPSDTAQVFLLWSASWERTRDLAEEYQIELPIVADKDRHLWRPFNVASVPFAVVVDELGRVTAKAYAHRAEQLKALLSAPKPGRDASQHLHEEFLAK